MNRIEKQAQIESMGAKFKKAQIALVVHNKGLTVAEMSALRIKMRAAGADFKVAKNHLAKIAAKDTRFEQIAELFKGPAAIATAADPVGVAKGLVEFAKTNDRLVI